MKRQTQSDCTCLNLSTWGTKVGVSLSSRPAFSTEKVQGQSGIHREMVSQKKKPQKKQYSFIPKYSLIKILMWPHLKEVDLRLPSVRDLTFASTSPGLCCHLMQSNITCLSLSSLVEIIITLPLLLLGTFLRIIIHVKVTLWLSIKILSFLESHLCMNSAGEGSVWRWEIILQWRNSSSWAYLSIQNSSFSSLCSVSSCTW